MSTSSEHYIDDNGMIRLKTLTITMPLTPYLVEQFGDFVILDCTAQITVYLDRQSINVSVLDKCGHTHPLSHTDVGGHRTGATKLF